MPMFVAQTEEKYFSIWNERGLLLKAQNIESFFYIETEAVTKIDRISLGRNKFRH